MRTFPSIDALTAWGGKRKKDRVREGKRKRERRERGREKKRVCKCKFARVRESMSSVCCKILCVLVGEKDNMNFGSQFIKWKGFTFRQIGEKVFWCERKREREMR